VTRDLKGEVAVITGGASGIGFAIADRLTREEMRIVLADVETGPLDRAVTRLREAGGEVIGVPTDVSDRDSVDALAKFVTERAGVPHILCNNAGVGPGAITWETPSSVWEWVIGVNLMGVIHGISAFVPGMVARGQGHVVNTASVAGLAGFPGMAAYCATKHAVVGLSQALQLDLELARSDVRVTVLCPGATKTRMNESGRNWPSTLGPPPPTGLLPGHPKTTESFLENFAATAADPAAVAEQLLEAVQAGRFWAVTDPDPQSWLLPHYHGIMGGTLASSRAF
jgi:NAD(P)-dependent dehydrogenase (short-subunit alcohol dehydrogenase family)